MKTEEYEKLYHITKFYLTSIGLRGKCDLTVGVSSMNININSSMLLLLVAKFTRVTHAVFTCKVITKHSGRHMPSRHYDCAA